MFESFIFSDLATKNKPTKVHACVLFSLLCQRSKSSSVKNLPEVESLSGIELNFGESLAAMSVKPAFVLLGVV